ncbi:hypothetical protein PPERSA_12706 [Pseudocohnilembus persalinus]|uniref:Uncharacterized protein n=1 Tax=Pseudocohnilembus persalinus TaxID=266149 RepID=A0A0V0QUA8_PSEPJ|nr:hypothetical protein PPERSA_12706 [Pseudocohnilembus persalinus]|eukprot:KRX05528.1 hypothetical protein PPERSA_12706 [Pseudocohnilembus persalinus]
MHLKGNSSEQNYSLSMHQNGKFFGQDPVFQYNFIIQNPYSSQGNNNTYVKHINGLQTIPKHLSYNNQSQQFIQQVKVEDFQHQKKFENIKFDGGQLVGQNLGLKRKCSQNFENGACLVNIKLCSNQFIPSISNEFGVFLKDQNQTIRKQENKSIKDKQKLKQQQQIQNCNESNYETEENTSFEDLKQFDSSYSEFQQNHKYYYNQQISQKKDSYLYNQQSQFKSAIKNQKDNVQLESYSSESSNKTKNFSEIKPCQQISKNKDSKRQSKSNSIDKKTKRHERNLYPYFGVHFKKSLRENSEFQETLQQQLNIENPVWYVIDKLLNEKLQTKKNLEDILYKKDQAINMAIKIWFQKFLKLSIQSTKNSKNKHISDTHDQRYNAFLRRGQKVVKFIKNLEQNLEVDQDSE